MNGAGGSAAIGFVLHAALGLDVGRRRGNGLALLHGREE